MRENSVLSPFHSNLLKILMCYANFVNGIVFDAKKSSGSVLRHFGEKKSDFFVEVYNLILMITIG